MIDSKELRIGNKILRMGNVVTVSTIDDCREEHYSSFLIGNYEDLASYTPKEYEPIPLTPEILERCGFKKHKGFSAIEWHNGDIEVDEIEDGYALFASEWTIGETFYFLHELQNICLDLFKIELEIKELQNA